MIINNDLTYTKKRANSLSELDKESKKAIDWVGNNKSVLELGCHTGNLSEWLQKKGCSVTGVDLNEQALKIAEPFLKKAVFADLESEEFWKKIEHERFDVITCMHVLEHLTNPWETLKRLKNHLDTNGEIIIALPNINNAKDRFNIFFGQFDYTKDGVMDQTHLRFFNHKTARQLIESADLLVSDYFSPWQVNPIHHWLDHIPLIFRLKNLFKADKVPFFWKQKPNLTDVVMVFRCK